MASQSKSKRPRKSTVASPVRMRLQEFVLEAYDSWGKFEKVTGIAHATAISWKPWRNGFPNFENLQILSNKGLSLDWLFTGYGDKTLRIGDTREGSVAEMMRPRLMRLAKVGPETADLAFTQMALTLEIDGILELAAVALLPQFVGAVDRLNALTFQGDVLTKMEKQLFEYQKAFGNGSAEERAAALHALRETFLELLPEDFRPNAPRRDRLIVALRESIDARL